MANLTSIGGVWQVAGIILLLIVAVVGGYLYGLRITRERSARDLADLNDIGLDLLRAPLDVTKLCELVYQRAGGIIQTSFFQIGLFEGDAYRAIVWVKDGERQPATRFGLGGQKGIIGWMRSSAKPLLVRDFELEQDSLPAFPEFGLETPPRSGMFVPLIAGEAVIGVIAIQSRQARRFTTEHLDLIKVLANQAAWAIRNAQQYQQAEYRAEQLRLIGEVSASVSALQPIPSLLEQLVMQIKERFGYYAVSLFLYEDDTLRVGASSSDVFPTGMELTWQGMIWWVAQNGQTALANDVTTDQRYTHLVSLPQTRSEVALPLKIEDQLLGVLDVQSGRKNSFLPETVVLLETLADQVAIALAQARAYAAERRSSERLEALVGVSRTVVSTLDVDDLLDRVVDLIADSFGYERIHIFVRQGRMFQFRAGAGPHAIRWLIDELSYSSNDDGIIPTVGRTGEPVLSGSVSDMVLYRPGPLLEDTQSELAVPIKMAGRVLGILDVQSELPNAFSKDDLVLLSALADTVAVALRNAALYTAERGRRNLAETLAEIGRTLISSLDLDAVLNQVLIGLGRVVSVDNAAILLLDDMSESITVAAAVGEQELTVKAGAQLPIDLLDVGEDVSRELAATHLYRVLLDFGQEATDRASIVAPLFASDQIIGYLLVDHHDPDRYTALDAETINTFASQAAVALANARLYRERQAEAYVTTVLLQVAETVNSLTDPLDALQTIARLTSLLAGVRKCLIFEYDSGSATVRYKAGYGLSVQQGDRLSAEVFSLETAPLFEIVSLLDQPMQLGTELGVHMPVLLKELIDPESVVMLPLRSRRGLVGVMMVDQPDRRLEQDVDRVFSVLNGIAHQTATTLESNLLQAASVERERLEREIEVARSIQASFIPNTAPDIPGWGFAAAWEAARQVSGDFYDFIPLRDGRWGLVIADVADKGVPAALFMAMSRTLLRAVAISHNEPAITLERVNHLLFNDTSTDLFVTVFYGVLEPSTGKLSYAIAGHNPPMVYHSDTGDVEVLPGKGIALGILHEISLTQQEVILNAGDMVVAYTDGVTEAMQADFTEWGMERFISTLEDVCQQPPDEVVSEVVDRIETFVAGAPQSDDLTLWCLKRASKKGG